MGSTPHSHAVADAKHPAEQGFTAMIVGWYFFAESNVKIVINSKAMTLNVFTGVVLTALDYYDSKILSGRLYWE